jgi:hypothetical protein
LPAKAIERGYLADNLILKKYSMDKWLAVLNKWTPPSYKYKDTYIEYIKSNKYSPMFIEKIIHKYMTEEECNKYNTPNDYIKHVVMIHIKECSGRVKVNNHIDVDPNLWANMIPTR